jgi:hypothetical protein
MNLKGYKAKYGDEELRRVCDTVGTSWTHMLAVIRGVKFLSRCMALHIEQVTGGECAFEDLVRRPTEPEFRRYLASHRGRGPKIETVTGQHMP